MKNVTNIPNPWIRAYMADPYDAGDSDFTTTQLSCPPQQQGLLYLHQDEIEEDIAEKLNAMMGTAIHAYMEKAYRSDPMAIVEKRFFHTVDGPKGEPVLISGQPDLIIGPSLQDYKLTSVWAFLRGEVKPEYKQQANLNRLFAAKNGVEVSELAIHAWYKDWSPRKATEHGYPSTPIETHYVKPHPLDKVEAWVRDRVNLHLKAREGTWPPCTPEERWENPTRYAVMKPGRKSALRVFENRWEAENLLAERPEACTIEVRPGEAKRCQGYTVNGHPMKYCPARDVCPQYKQEQGR